MNSHVKRWIDIIILSLSIDEVFTSITIRERLVEERGTNFICDNSAIGWYLKRNKNVRVICDTRGRREYRRI
mgnify:CR=1 FL=1|tara:strand:- start:132 stop:347 length:216 start_codon:yes stop_codon:yes gene_type:complete